MTDTSLQTFEPTYTFRFTDGQSAPHSALRAKDDDDFFKNVLPAWEKEAGKKHVPGSVKCHISQMRDVPEPTQEAAASANNADSPHSLVQRAREREYTPAHDYLAPDHR